MQSKPPGLVHYLKTFPGDPPILFKPEQCQSISEVSQMRTTVNLDDDLLVQAKNLSGVEDRGALLKEALRALIERESARRLARLGCAYVSG